MAMISGPVTGAVIQELQLLRKLPELGRAVLTEATRRPCIILAPAAFAASQQHSSAIHVRLHAPLAARVATYQREHLVDHDRARNAVTHNDRSQHDWVRTLYHADLTEDALFTIALDTSRFTREQLVNILLAAG